MRDADYSNAYFDMEEFGEGGEMDYYAMGYMPWGGMMPMGPEAVPPGGWDYAGEYDYFTGSMLHYG